MSRLTWALSLSLILVVGCSGNRAKDGSAFDHGASDDVLTRNKSLPGDGSADLYCPAASNLVCHLKFDGDLEDSSASEIDGRFEYTILDWAAQPVGDKEEAEGATATYIGNGVCGKAVRFNGRNESVKLPDSGIMAPQDEITISAWVRPDRVDDHVGHQIYRKEGGDANRQMLAIKKEGHALTFGLTTGGQYKELEAPVDPARIKDGNWHLVTAAYDGSARRVYLDGELLAESRTGGMIGSTERQNGNASTFIGSSCGKSEFYMGGIDDFRMYDCALTGEQIKHMAESREDHSRSGSP
jgi:hypothetical protein